MTAPILTDVVGVPATITRRDQLTGTMSFDPPFLGGVVGGGVGVVPIRWSVGNARWENVNTSGQLQTPAARDDVPGVVKPEGMVIFDLHWIDEGNVRRSAHLEFFPQANAAGVLDLTETQNPKRYLPTADLLEAFEGVRNAPQVVEITQALIETLQEEADGLAALTALVAPALTEMNQATTEALGVTGINPAYISATTADPPAAPNGTRGARRTVSGGLQRLIRTAGAWVPEGTPLLGEGSLQPAFRARQGYNLVDYFDLVVDGDYAPALNAMFDAVPPYGNATIPSGDFRTDSPVVITKPLGRLHSAGATLLVNHAGIGIEVKPIRGTFGLDLQPDGTYDNSQNTIQFPALLRQRPITATTLDGSTGIRIWNSIYCTYEFQEVSGFGTGIHLYAHRIGSEQVSAFTYCDFRYTLLRNTVNLKIEAEKDTSGAASSNGYVSDNHHWGGSFGSYFTTSVGDGGVLMNDTHVRMIGTDRADMMQRNVFHKPTYENSQRHGVVMTGKCWGNTWHEPRFEMPFAIDRFSTDVNCQFNSLFNTYGFGPDYPTALADLGRYTRITSNQQYYGLLEYYDGKWRVDQGEGTPVLPSGGLIEWIPSGPRAPVAASQLVYSGTPLTIDLSKDRSWFVTANSDMPAASIVFSNPPVGRPSRVYVTLYQGNATTRTIHPDVFSGSVNGVPITTRFQGRDRVELSIDQVAGVTQYSVDSVVRLGGVAPRVLDGTAIPTAGAWRKGDYIRNLAAVVAGDPLGWQCSVAGTPGTWVVTGRVQPQLIIKNNLDNNVTHNAATLQATYLFQVPITAIRYATLNLPATGLAVPTGAIVRVGRTAAATGAFAVQIRDSAFASLGSIAAAGAWKDFQFDGTNWLYIGSGTME